MKKFNAFANFVLLIILAITLIVLVTWPWAQHFDGALLRHWDPPFHAWKLEFMAKRILAGDPLFFNRETTLLYPHTGTLYFEAIQWPASMLGALFFGLTNWSPEYIYHIVMLIMWGLSAPCMFIFLKKIGISSCISGAVSLAFCILPYRISYMNEFQMQFAFVTPLVFVAIQSFFEKPSPRAGILIAFLMWLYAVTELNQAIFIVFTFPFFVASHLAKNPSFFQQRNVWRGIIAASITMVLLVPILLWPYAVQHMAGAVDRELSEVDRHSVQVLSFIKPFGRFRLWDFNAKVEEWQAYPTLIVALLGGFSITSLCIKSIKNTSAPKWRRFAPMPLVCSCVIFLLLTVLFQMSYLNNSSLCVTLWSYLPLFCAVSALLVCFSAGDENETKRTQYAMLGAMVFCAFLTNGPFLALNIGEQTFKTGNKLYLALYKYGPFLSGFRAACRFGVFVHFILLFFMAFSLDSILRRISISKLPISFKKIIPFVTSVLLIGAVAIEAIPPKNVLSFKRVEKPQDNPVVKYLDKRDRPFTLAVLPMGSRSFDGQTMFYLLKNKYNSFYAWCGYIPPETFKVNRAIMFGDYNSAYNELCTLWPECLFLVDGHKSTRASANYRKTFPSHVIRKKNSNDYIVDYPSALSPYATIEKKDSRFTLLSLKPQPATKKVVKKFRSDYGRKYPYAQLSLSGTNTPVNSVILNDSSISYQVIGDQIEAQIPKKLLVKAGVNILIFKFEDEVAVSDFTLTGKNAE